MWRDSEKRKSYQKEYVRNHYLRNKEKYISKASKSNVGYRERNKEYVKNYLLTHPCVDCGNDELVVLDFDHVRGKKYKGISQLVAYGSALKTIINEIAKCDVRCANCHRRITHNRRIKEAHKGVEPLSPVLKTVTLPLCE